MKFSSIEYEISNGRKPKGTGSWAFSTERNPKVEDMWFFFGTLAEAKKQAAAKAKAMGIPSGTTLYILP